MSGQVRIVQRINDRACANVECENTSYAGPFVLVQVGPDRAVGGHRSLRLLVCAPCGEVLMQTANR